MTSFNSKIASSSLGAKKVVQARSTVSTKSAASVVLRASAIRAAQKSSTQRGGK
jgi:hypothetical protein